MTRVALVTAASRGIGAACASCLAEAGYTVGLMARSDEIHELAARLGGFAVQGSVTDLGAMNNLVDMAFDRYRRIDAVVNNTGHPPKGPLLGVSDQEWQEGTEMLLMNVVRMARLVTPIMQENGGGSFINISSLWAIEPHESGPVSSTIRAALGAYTKLFADQYAAENIRMNALLPGYVDSHPVPEDMLSAIPAGRAASAEEIGKIAVFLASPEASYITGQSLRADGGLTRSV